MKLSFKSYFAKKINLRIRIIFEANILCLYVCSFFLISYTVSSILEVELYNLARMIIKYQTPTVIKF